MLGLVKTLIQIWLGIGIDDILMRRMSGAMTNSVYSVTVQDGALLRLGPGEPAKMLLRIYGNGTDGLFSRRKELECTERLADAGIAPRWLGIFSNGRFEEFVENIPVTAAMIREPQLSAMVGRKLFYLHNRADIIQQAAQTDEEQKSVLWKRLAEWRTRGLAALRKLQARELTAGQQEYLGRILGLGIESAGFVAGMQEQKAACKAVLSPRVLCHNDLHQGNVMLRHDDRSIILIDFEYAALGPRGYDFANHFCEWAADYSSEDSPERLDYEEGLPTAEQQRNFAQAYCDEAQQHGHTVDVEALLREARAFIPISHLLWGHWGLVQAASSYIDFDYLRYAYERLQQYLAAQ